MELVSGPQMVAAHENVRHCFLACHLKELILNFSTISDQIYFQGRELYSILLQKSFRFVAISASSVRKHEDIVLLDITLDLSTKPAAEKDVILKLIHC